jgi:hypothetical protein
MWECCNVEANISTFDVRTRPTVKTELYRHFDEGQKA